VGLATPRIAGQLYFDSIMFTGEALRNQVAESWPRPGGDRDRLSVSMEPRPGRPHRVAAGLE